MVGFYFYINLLEKNEYLLIFWIFVFLLKKTMKIFLMLVTLSSYILINDYSPIRHKINVIAESRNDYILSGTDNNGNVGGMDPEITFHLGTEIKFQINAPGHPFYLKVKRGIGKKNLIQDVDNNGTTEGVINWTPAEKGTFYYQCGKHKNMVGIIKII